jgi:hypothetical protein
MSGHLQIPTDTWAEGALTGCAIASRRGADLARARVEPGDLWDPRLACMYRAALDDALTGIGDVEARVLAVAALAGIDESEVARVVDDRPVMWDVNGGFARRVLDAAKRRAVMTHCAKAYNQLAGGARLNEVADLIRRIEAALAC